MTNNYWHSVTLDPDKCKGCTNCIKNCPTQAIRVQQGKAKIIKERCIDCGNCIRVCPYHAKKAVTDSFKELEKFKYNVAIVAPAFYGQFSKTEDVNVIMSSLTKIGFDYVYEVAVGAKKITDETRKLLNDGKLKKPVISSACPAVERLIGIKFPNLIDHLLPFKSPMEISATAARREAAKKSGYKPSEIGVFFISPCAAKMTAVKTIDTDVDGVLSIKDTYMKLAHRLSRVNDVHDFSKAGKEGILWATSGGESNASEAERRIAVDGMQNVLYVLEQIEDGKMDEIDFVEILACTGGCVGGPLTAENNFLANSRIKRIAENIETKECRIDDDIDIYRTMPLEYKPIMHLDSDMKKAMEMAIRMEEIYNSLPKLDCGSCGAPTCMALAEDIVRGHASVSDCIFKLRERVKRLEGKKEDTDENFRSN